MDEIRDKWNRRWREQAAEPIEPDPWLLRVRPFLPTGGEALDLACGRGGNALFLATEGFSVTAFDISQEALAQLEAEAARRGLRLQTRRADLEAGVHLPKRSFELVLSFFYLHRPLLPQLLSAVRPGGVAVMRTFSRAGSFPGGPGNPEFVLRPGELPALFAGWEILLHEEGFEPSKKGGSLAGIVARRPVDAELRQEQCGDIPSPRLHIEAHCTGCGRCLAACPERALTLVTERPDGRGRRSAALLAERCNGCGACLAACPRQALRRPGAEEPLPPATSGARANEFNGDNLPRLSD